MVGFSWETNIKILGQYNELKLKNKRSYHDQKVIPAKNYVII